MNCIATASICLLSQILKPMCSWRQSNYSTQIFLPLPPQAFLFWFVFLLTIRTGTWQERMDVREIFSTLLYSSPINILKSHRQLTQPPVHFTQASNNPGERLLTLFFFKPLSRYFLSYFFEISEFQPALLQSLCQGLDLGGFLHRTKMLWGRKAAKWETRAP